MVLGILQLGLQISNPVTGVGLFFLRFLFQELILHLELAYIIVQCGVVLGELVVSETLGLKLCAGFLQLLFGLFELEPSGLFGGLEGLA